MSKPLTDLLSEFKSLAILLLVLVGSFAAGWYGKSFKADSEYSLLLSEKNELTDSLNISNNKTTSLETLLDGKSKRIEELKLIIANLKDSPKEVTHVVETVTKLVPKEKEKIVYVQAESCQEPAPDYTYRTEEGLAVAKFSSKTEKENIKYNYETAELELKSTVVIGDDSTAVLLKAKSSLDKDKEITIEVQDVLVTEIRDFKIFEPHIQVNLAMGVEFAPPGVIASGTVSVPLVHLSKDRIDVLAPKIGFNEKDVRLGIDAVGYNIGHDLPVITDLWISAGISTGLVTQSGVSFDISVGSKF